MEGFSPGFNPPATDAYHSRGNTKQKNDHRRTRTCNLLVPSAIEAKRATIAPGSLTSGDSTTLMANSPSLCLGNNCTAITFAMIYQPHTTPYADRPTLCFITSYPHSLFERSWLSTGLFFTPIAHQSPFPTKTFYGISPQELISL